MNKIPYKPSRHIFVCTNSRAERDCCSSVGGYEIFRELKDFVKANGLSSSVWITRTGCLGFCNNTGTTIAIYPDNIWYREVKMEELDAVKKIIMPHKTL